MSGSVQIAVFQCPVDLAPHKLAHIPGYAFAQWPLEFFADQFKNQRAKCLWGHGGQCAAHLCVIGRVGGRYLPQAGRLRQRPGLGFGIKKRRTSG